MGCGRPPPPPTHCLPPAGSGHTSISHMPTREPKIPPRVTLKCITRVDGTRQIMERTPTSALHTYTRTNLFLYAHLPPPGPQNPNYKLVQVNLVQVYHVGDDAEAEGTGVQEWPQPSRASYFLALTHHCIYPTRTPLGYPHRTSTPN